MTLLTRSRLQPASSRGAILASRILFIQQITLKSEVQARDLADEGRERLIVFFSAQAFELAFHPQPPPPNSSAPSKDEPFLLQHQLQLSRLRKRHLGSVHSHRNERWHLRLGRWLFDRVASRSRISYYSVSFFTLVEGEGRG